MEAQRRWAVQAAWRASQLEELSKSASWECAMLASKGVAVCEGELPSLWAIVAAALALELKLEGLYEGGAVTRAIGLAETLREDNAKVARDLVASMDAGASPGVAPPLPLDRSVVCRIEKAIVESCGFRVRFTSPYPFLEELADACKFGSVVRAIGEQCVNALVVAPPEQLQAPMKVATAALYVACATKGLDPAGVLRLHDPASGDLHELVAELVAQSRQVIDPARARKQIVAAMELA